jgi:hypothetical protein
VKLNASPQKDTKTTRNNSQKTAEQASKVITIIQIPIQTICESFNEVEGQPVPVR